MKEIEEFISAYKNQKRRLRIEKEIIDGKLAVIDEVITDLELLQEVEKPEE